MPTQQTSDENSVGSGTQSGHDVAQGRPKSRPRRVVGISACLLLVIVWVAYAAGKSLATHSARPPAKTSISMTNYGQYTSKITYRSYPPCNPPKCQPATRQAVTDLIAKAAGRKTVHVTQSQVTSAAFGDGVRQVLEVTAQPEDLKATLRVEAGRLPNAPGEAIVSRAALGLDAGATLPVMLTIAGASGVANELTVVGFSQPDFRNYPNRLVAVAAPQDHVATASERDYWLLAGPRLDRVDRHYLYSAGPMLAIKTVDDVTKRHRGQFAVIVAAGGVGALSAWLHVLYFRGLKRDGSSVSQDVLAVAFLGMILVGVVGSCVLRISFDVQASAVVAGGPRSAAVADFVASAMWLLGLASVAGLFVAWVVESFCSGEARGDCDVGTESVTAVQQG